MTIPYLIAAFYKFTIISYGKIILATQGLNKY
jgi:hypothetical protein